MVENKGQSGGEHNTILDAIVKDVEVGRLYCGLHRNGGGTGDRRGGLTSTLVEEWESEYSSKGWQRRIYLSISSSSCKVVGASGEVLRRWVVPTSSSPRWRGSVKGGARCCSG